MSPSWKPCATPELWRQRMDLIQQIRSFFASRSILEVESPILSHCMGSDPQIDYLETRSFVDGPVHNPGEALYLCTSPEFHMKRLLAAGWGDIWQLTRAFRGGESGARHNPEFSILEWYRVEWDWNALMNEVAELCATLAGNLDGRGAQLARSSFMRTTWREAYVRHCGLDPVGASDDALLECARSQGISLVGQPSRQVVLDSLMVLVIEPRLGKRGPEFLTRYPAEQAALAQVETDASGWRWARRFELYLDGVELANGYQELCDPDEQANRFATDLEQRKEMGKRCPPIDESFLDSLRHGLPACSGVALGVDRLVMLLLDKESIADTLTFPIDRA
ncbi:MAG TPA: EF-P lysine aminoacylase EpmA [Fibrobacteraceae bacterium]|nr:EF-P lysine aminoacylase EpmA [Fibrobacteraceae bacterium]